MDTQSYDEKYKEIRTARRKAEVAILSNPYIEHKIDLFLSSYLLDFNASKAAVAAGYSKSSSSRAAQIFLKDPRVLEAIENEKKKLRVKYQVTAENILSEALNIASVDPLYIFDENDKVKSLKDIPENIRRAIASVEVFEEFQGTGKNREFIGLTKKIKFWDKTKALELIAKYLGLLVDRVEITAPSVVRIANTAKAEMPAIETTCEG